MKAMLGLVLVAALATFASAGPKENTWTQLKDAKWTPLDPKAGDKGPQVSVVFGDMTKKAPIGFILKVPPGFKAGAHTHTSDDYAVIIQGTVHNFKSPGTDEGPGMTPGGAWFQPAKQPHDNECEASSKDGCLIFVYMANGFDFKPWTEPAKKGDAPKAGAGSGSAAPKK
jgi:hypothetical protein